MGLSKFKKFVIFKTRVNTDVNIDRHRYVIRVNSCSYPCGSVSNMAVPKQRHTKSRRNKRRLHIYIKPLILGYCPKCKKAIRPHTVCLNCGYYKKKEIIDVLSKLTKKERKKRDKEIKIKDREEQKERPLSIEELSRK